MIHWTDSADPTPHCTCRGRCRDGGRRRAFTLIELLVVIAIIALLVTILVPSLAQAKKLAQLAACAVQLRSTGAGIAQYGAEYDGRIPIYDPGGNMQSNILKNPFSSYRWEGLGLLLYGEYASGRDQFSCPGHRYHGESIYNLNEASAKSWVGIDYALGWYGRSDQRGSNDLRLKDRKSGFYTVPGTTWFGGPAESNFSPTLEQYRTDWVRDANANPPAPGAYSTRTWGAHVLVVDARDRTSSEPGRGWNSAWGGIRAPTDSPHLGIGNILTVDLSVQSAQDAFPPEANHSMNLLPYQWYWTPRPYRYWFIWAETQIVR